MKSLLVVFCLLITSAAFSQETPLWLRYPAISPDGESVLFEYKGDIYKVAAVGGNATPLTISETYEFAPVWSHDGKSIAFASNRYGNFDVFVMPSSGGEAKRLTFHSAREIPSSFSADDKSVLFNCHRQDPVTDTQFPSPMLVELYSAPVTGGKIKQELPAPALDATLSSKGDKIIYHDIKGYESDWRKHHRSAVTRDIWVYDIPKKAYTQLSQFDGEDRNPVFDSNDNDYYYLSEQNGSFNVVKSSLTNPTQVTAITKFSKHPVRFLTRSSNNTLCFSFDGELYTQQPGSEPKKIAIRIAADGRSTLDKIVPVNEGFTEAKLSPNGKEFAFVFRGEVFVSSVEGGVTKRITNTPWQERSISFSSDGRKLVYAAEKNSNWNIYISSIARAEEPYFYASTIIKEETAIATPEEEFQPSFSPDAKEVAYLENRVTLKVVNLAAHTSRLIMAAEKNYSYADGDQYYQWSPDGKWFLVTYGSKERIFSPEIGMIAAAGGEIHNLSLSGYSDSAPKWAMDGKMVIWGSDREGTLNQGGGTTSGNVYGLFLSRATFDRFNLSKAELALLKEQEEKDKEKETDKEEKKTTKGGKKATAKDSVAKPVAIDWSGLTDRKRRLTAHTSPLNDWVLSKDGEKLFYLTQFEKGTDLWVNNIRNHETKQVSKLGANQVSMELSADGKFLFLLADGKAMTIEVENENEESLSPSGEMVLKQADERSYIFDHSWRQFKEKFYVADLHGVDWEFYYKEYKKFLPYINNNYDFAEMLSEMLGEVNASHTGSGYGYYDPNSDATATLCVFYDLTYVGKGLKIAEVIEGGPVDKAASKIRAGHIIEKIDGIAVSDSVDFYQLLNRKADKLTLLSVFDPATNSRWDEPVKPTNSGMEGELLYKRWVKNRRNDVEKLSGGKLGYVHVRSMNDASMRTVYDDALGRNIGKDALVVDTRFNGGGNIHEQLSDFLSGKKYFDIIPHGQHVGYEPYDKWIKPSIVIIGESNYSDAHLFPVAFKLKGLGKTIGMPVPGTGTFVWWETQIDPSLYFGIPMGGWQMPDGKFCENNQMEPDIKVKNAPDVMAGGRDQQIEEAVKEMLKK